MTVRETATSPQFLSKSEMMIGAWSQDDGTKLLLKVNEALIMSLDDDDIPTVFKVPIGAPKQADYSDGFSAWAPKRAPKLHTLLYKMLGARSLLES